MRFKDGDIENFCKGFIFFYVKLTETDSCGCRVYLFSTLKAQKFPLFPQY